MTREELETVMKLWRPKWLYGDEAGDEGAAARALQQIILRRCLADGGVMADGYYWARHTTRAERKAERKRYGLRGSKKRKR